MVGVKIFKQNAICTPTPGADGVITILPETSLIECRDKCVDKLVWDAKGAVFMHASKKNYCHCFADSEDGCDLNDKNLEAWTKFLGEGPTLYKVSV